MPRLVRPYIPLAIRVRVAERQLWGRGPEMVEFYRSSFNRPVAEISNKRRLAQALRILFGETPWALDHDPALGLRAKIFKRGKFHRYEPDARPRRHKASRWRDTGDRQDGSPPAQSPDDPGQARLAPPGNGGRGRAQNPT
jgi:hypothetical protein